MNEYFNIIEKSVRRSKITHTYESLPIRFDGDKVSSN